MTGHGGSQGGSQAADGERDDWWNLFLWVEHAESSSRGVRFGQGGGFGQGGRENLPVSAA